MPHETYCEWSTIFAQIIYVGYLFAVKINTVNMGSDRCHCEDIIRFATQCISCQYSQFYGIRKHINGRYRLVDYIRFKLWIHGTLQWVLTFLGCISQYCMTNMLVKVHTVTSIRTNTL